MARYGKFTDSNTQNAEDIVATSSGGQYTDEVLRSLGFYPIVEIEDQSEALSRKCTFTLVEDESGGHIEQRFVAIDLPKTYSKIKILEAAKAAGFLNDLLDFIESNREVSYIWNASNVIENNSLLDQYLESIATALGKTEEEVLEFLDQNCIVD